jgi:integrase/recombinase XerD
VQKKKRKLPEVFTTEEVFRIIHSAGNLKHKTILMLTYSSGLRVGELVNLKVEDILREPMRLKVRDAKGGRDRYTLLSEICLNQLEQYWKAYRPVNWLFCGKSPGEQISIRAVQHAYQRAKRIAGITKQCGIHTLRHSFATHMIETGSGIFQLQKFLGHRHLTTTLVYVHLNEEKTMARSPLDVYAERFHNATTDND